MIRKTLCAAFVIALMAAILPLAGYSQSGNMPIILLEGFVWELRAYGPVNAQAPTLSDTRITAEFEQVGFFTGNAGCNDYSGSFTGDIRALNIGSIGTTRKSCEPAVSEQENEYLNAFQRAEFYKVNGDRLEIFYDTGRSVLSYRAEPETVNLPEQPPASGQPVAGKIWILTSMGDRNNPIPVVSNTEVGLTFAGQQIVYGNAGCNAFNGTAVTDGISLQIGNLATTQKFCSSPPGVMEQESAFLSALQAAERYTLTVDTLQIFYKNQTEALNFVALP